MLTCSRYLTYAGLVPLFLCTLLLHYPFQIPHFNPMMLPNIIYQYCCFILSFMLGSFWGIHLLDQTKDAAHLSYLSTGLFVLLWASGLYMTIHSHLILCILLFLCLPGIDYMCWQKKRIDTGYFQTRCIVSGLLVLNILYIVIYFV